MIRGLIAALHLIVLFVGMDGNGEKTSWPLGVKGHEEACVDG